MIDFGAAAGGHRHPVVLAGRLDMAVPGLVIGLVFGAMPGISITMAMALFLPMTLYMDFLPAIIFLTSIYTGAGFGGSVPAVLMNIPGTSSAVATTFDGYPMARRGEHNEALGDRAVVVGVRRADELSDPVHRHLAARLCRAEDGAARTVRGGDLGHPAARLAGRALRDARACIAGVFGLLLGTVGMNTAGYMRGTMGIPWLLDGIPHHPGDDGAAGGEPALHAGQRDVPHRRRIQAHHQPGPHRAAAGAWPSSYPMVIIRGSSIGAFIGAIPGVGSSISNLISYAQTKREDADSESFGKGNPKGVVAAESANSSSEGGAMATMLALGIPGGGATAILLAAFAMHNIVGGPSFIGNNKDIVYAIIFSNMAQAVLLLFVGLGFVYFAGYVVRVPLRFLIPTVLVLASFGSYAIDGTIAGPITLFVFSIVGWALARYEYPVAAVVVGLILGNLVETQFLRSWQVSGGDISYILQRPGAMAIVAVMIGSMALTAWTKRRRAKRRAVEATGH